MHFFKSGNTITGSTGNIALGIDASKYKIISCEVNGYIGVPFINGGDLFIKVIKFDTFSFADSVDVNYTVYYIPK